MSDPRNRSPWAPDSMLDPRIIDPGHELVEYSSLGAGEIAQIVRVLSWIRNWRETEAALSFQSRNDMQLNETDMKALRFLVIAKNQSVVATPGLLSEHLNISTAATTKLLDRLAAAGHIERSPHPTDRRVLMISITDGTHEQVRETVGRSHARRFEVAARLTPDEREVVIRFLNDLSGTGITPDAGAGAAAERSPARREQAPADRIDGGGATPDPCKCRPL